jgi:hypothetical protein
VSLPHSTVFWLFVPPAVLLIVTVVWSVKHWNREP